MPHTSESRIAKRYLGDGVYVEVEAGMLKLTTEREGRIETIYLEPEVFDALREFYYDARAVYAAATVDEHPEDKP